MNTTLVQPKNVSMLNSSFSPCKEKERLGFRKKSIKSQSFSQNFEVEKVVLGKSGFGMIFQFLGFDDLYLSRVCQRGKLKEYTCCHTGYMF